MERNKILIVALALWCISMALPGVSFVDRTGTHSMYGIYILGFGWVAMAEWVFAWFANPLFLFAVFRSRVERGGTLLTVATISFILGLSAFMMKKIPNFSGVETPAAHLAIGYYVWMIALGLLVLYSFMRYRHPEQNLNETKPVVAVDYRAILIKNAPAFVGMAIMLIMLAYVLLTML